MTNGLVIIRRDIRLHDNTALNLACKMCSNVYICFVFSPKQVTSTNKFRSMRAIRFMIDSLTELDSEIKDRTDGKSWLITMYGDDHRCIEALVRGLEINAVFTNKDYTPYAIERDSALQSLCDRHGVEFCCTDDYVLTVPGVIMTASSGTPYKVFTPYYNRVIEYVRSEGIAKPITHSGLSSKIASVSPSLMKKLLPSSLVIHLDDALAKFVPKSKFGNEPCLAAGPGRVAALKSLARACPSKKSSRSAPPFVNYDDERDYVYLHTTRLSAPIKFGCVSIREVFHRFTDTYGLSHALVRQLIWRDFYTQLLFHFPHALTGPLKAKYSGLSWSKSKARFAAWKEGRTGVPIVDAGMRELNATGYMHNRARLIVASYLVKTLQTNWQWGEKYFATKLCDYDPAVNNGNWQWVASTGADSQPYFRIFNPWTQGKRYDPDCKYIKKWIPELRDVPASDIHKWYSTHDEYDVYTAPIVDYVKQRKVVLAMYNNTLKGQ